MGADPRTHIPKSYVPKLGRYTVSSPVTPLHRRPSQRSGLETQLLWGWQFDVYDIKKIWAWGQSQSPIKGSKQKGYVGYIPLKYLRDKSLTSNHKVSVLKAPLFSKADIKSPIKAHLHLGALLKVKKISDKFFQLESGEFIHANHLRSRSLPPSETDFVTIAEQHIGLPYIWGGLSTDGLDCSGLVQSSLRAAGIDAPRDADMQEEGLGANLPLNRSGLKRGDLIFWKGHVGIMTSARAMIHANAYHMCVKIEPLADAVKRIEGSGGGEIRAIKRF